MRTSTVTRAIRAVLVGADRRPSWLAGRPTWLRRLTVAVVTAVTTVGYPLCAWLAEAAHHVDPLTAGLVAVGEMLPLALVIRYPLVAWRLGWLAALLTPLTPGQPWGNWPWDPPQIPVLVLAFCVAGLRVGRAELWVMWAVTLGALWLWVPDPADSIGGSIAFTMVTVLVDTLADRHRVRRALTEQTATTQREQHRRTILETRAQIARELHDVVAHHMSLIAVQAETAPYRHPAVTEPVREEFTAISASARAALTEMRQLLGVLRHEDGAEPPRTPQPGLADLPDLVAAARQAGIPVELSTMDELAEAEVSATVGLAAYRVLQESLSNAGRHAPGATVTVGVSREPTLLRLTIHNGGVVVGGSAPGHGLSGMRERVALVGGSLSAGRDGSDGFAVVATFPLSRVDA